MLHTRPPGPTTIQYFHPVLVFGFVALWPSFIQLSYIPYIHSRHTFTQTRFCTRGDIIFYWYCCCPKPKPPAPPPPPLLLFGSPSAAGSPLGGGGLWNCSADSRVKRMPTPSIRASRTPPMIALPAIAGTPTHLDGDEQRRTRVIETSCA